MVIFCTPGSVFIALCFLLRITMSLGSTAFLTSSFSLGPSSFPDNAAIVAVSRPIETTIRTKKEKTEGQGMFNLTTHSYLRLLWRQTYYGRGNPLPPQYGLIFSSILLAARFLFYPPSDIRDRSPILIIFPLFSIV